MTWLGELSHVARKDLRQHRLLVALYVVIAAVATGHAVGAPLLQRATFGPSMLFVTVVGILLVASVVQADSPTRTDAFWATHPFRRPVMLGEKVVFALAVLVVAAVGQAIGVASYDVSAATVARQVLVPAGVFGVCLLVAMLLAGLTRNLSAFVLAVIGVLISVFITSATLDQDFPSLGGARPAVQALGFVAVAALVVWLYLRRDGRPAVRALGLVVTALALLSTCDNGPRPVSAERAVAGAPSPITVTLEPVVDRRRPAQPGQLELVVRASGIEEGMSGQVVMHGVDVELRDGSHLRLPMEQEWLNLGAAPFAPVPPPIPGVRWLSPPPRREAQTIVVPRLTPQQRQRIASGVTTIALNAEVALWDARIAGSLPLAPGAGLTRGGHRVRVVAIRPENPVATLALDVRRIVGHEPLTSREIMMADGAGVVLVNERRREAMAMTRTSAAGGLDGLVLPGTDFHAEIAQFGMRQSLGPDMEVALSDTMWLRGARLVLLANEYRGSYPIRVPLGAPRPGNDTIPRRTSIPHVGATAIMSPR